MKEDDYKLVKEIRVEITETDNFRWSFPVKNYRWLLWLLLKLEK
jgi:hypothetical protein